MKEMGGNQYMRRSFPVILLEDSSKMFGQFTSWSERIVQLEESDTRRN